MYYADDIVNELRESEQIVIFGAGIVAYNAINCLIRKPYCLKIDYSIVSDLRINPEHIMGIPVIDFKMAKLVIKKNAAVLIAAIDKNRAPIQELLHSHGYLNTISIAFHSDLWEQLRGNYFREYCFAQKAPYRTLEEEVQKISLSADIKTDFRNVHLYAVRSHMDKKLCEDVSRYSWEIPIQAGTALTTERVCEVCDHRGDNISSKNKEYCELTALYWIWKHDMSDYVGLCHYRRHFEFNKEIIRKIIHSDIDVILTIPILNFPNVRAVYDNDHVIEDWDIMLEAIEKVAFDYRKTAESVQNGQFYYGYNMFVARREILNNYCEWLFPILAYCEERCSKKGDVYQNRYIGFLAERLLSIYFIHHKEDYKIVHARKHFIE